MAAKRKVIQASVVIRKPREDVFGFYRDFRNLPRFLGDVMAVERVDPTDSRWTIHGSSLDVLTDDQRPVSRFDS